MDQRERNIQIADLIESAKKVAILPSVSGGVDAFSAGAGLYYLLKDKQKDVDFIYTGTIPESCTDLMNLNEIKHDAGVKELVVSIDYAASPGAKAQYTTNNGILFIKLSPVSPNFDLSKAQIELQGQNYDLVFTIGVQKPEDLGQLYEDMKHVFSRSKVVNVDTNEANQRFGLYPVVEPQEQFNSLLVLNVSRFWRLKVNPSAAKALLKGISHGMA